MRLLEAKPSSDEWGKAATSEGIVGTKAIGCVVEVVVENAVVGSSFELEYTLAETCRIVGE